jgi:hypothetical protein
MFTSEIEMITGTSALTVAIGAVRTPRPTFFEVARIAKAFPFPEVGRGVLTAQHCGASRNSFADRYK